MFVPHEAIHCQFKSGAFLFSYSTLGTERPEASSWWHRHWQGLCLQTSMVQLLSPLTHTPVDLQILQESECSPAPSAQELMGQLRLYSTLNEVNQESLDPHSQLEEYARGRVLPETRRLSCVGQTLTAILSACYQPRVGAHQHWGNVEAMPRACLVSGARSG